MGFLVCSKDRSESLKILQDSEALIIQPHQKKPEKKELLENLYYEETSRKINTATLYSCSTAEPVKRYNRQNSMVAHVEDGQLKYWLKNNGKIEPTVSHQRLWTDYGLGHLTNDPILQQPHDNLHSTVTEPVLPGDPVPAADPNDVSIDLNPILYVFSNGLNLQDIINLNRNMRRDIMEQFPFGEDLDIRALIPERAQIVNQMVCMVCVNESDEKYIVLPCGHAWLCIECVRQLQRENQMFCPACRIRNVVFQRMLFF
ncbi:uncharacterized protein LOC114122923 isoform X1 [Aphis gossypii]|uniref:uncharacterized protein LOC114122923 isoform X1 n=1 Tax=Aphis gossypii TaxID=80765 RepID=UPI0021593866|nr:uncharacterized protein LOC114122923 isoform X1 [Aphis gossypii]XP_050057227.1 uncharacterized protein LOC114122923 isoform X1 [Aphis gossypii]XP_050057228.1 uncharacterized protein LOC114122923 isoform X1 [Aphis gossypii]XP_050057229.1 uncharacterized protein LOC114122923 isoform X1 [Aphis gossypii]XP_050057230.1 uncharacterized protein LOC114122923 isoform X1 [Aphis gossypii]XP_050057231.1 uncharacterized protein LOC114122923 isoform X1 [Aphis gossypii]XP_050057232.1 uncharacterized prot